MYVPSVSSHLSSLHANEERASRHREIGVGLAEQCGGGSGGRSIEAMRGLATGRPTLLTPHALAALDARGWAVVPGFLDAEAAIALRDDARACSHLAWSARVGHPKNGEMALKEEVRTSRMLPLYPPPPPAVGSIEARMRFADTVRALCDSLNAAELSFLRGGSGGGGGGGGGVRGGGARLGRFDTELSYLYYEPGGFYRRHVGCPLAPARDLAV